MMNLKSYKKKFLGSKFKGKLGFCNYFKLDCDVEYVETSFWKLHNFSLLCIKEKLDYL